MPLKRLLFWTVICSVVGSVGTVAVFKMAGLELGGWSGGIGAGIGVVFGHLIAAKTSPADTE